MVGIIISTKNALDGLLDGVGDRTDACLCPHGEGRPRDDRGIGTRRLRAGAQATRPVTAGGHLTINLAMGAGRAADCDAAFLDVVSLRADVPAAAHSEAVLVRHPGAQHPAALLIHVAHTEGPAPVRRGHTLGQLAVLEAQVAPGAPGHIAAALNVATAVAEAGSPLLLRQQFGDLTVVAGKVVVVAARCAHFSNLVQIWKSCSGALWWEEGGKKNKR